MKTTNRFIFLLFLPLILFGCKKDLTFTFKGTVTNSSGSNLSGITVSIEEDQGTFNSSYKTVGSGVTNSSGQYEVVVDRNQVNSFRVKTNHNNFHGASKIILFDNVSTENDNIVDFTTETRSWVKFNLLSTNENTDLSLLKLSGNSACPDCCPNEYSFFYGEIDSYKICGANAGEYFKFGIQKPGISYEVDSVLCPEVDTIEYSITF